VQNHAKRVNRLYGHAVSKLHMRAAGALPHLSWIAVQKTSVPGGACAACAPPVAAMAIAAWSAHIRSCPSEGCSCFVLVATCYICAIMTRGTQRTTQQILGGRVRAFPLLFF
jgi:hypothetical protein